MSVDAFGENLLLARSSSIGATKEADVRSSDSGVRRVVLPCKCEESARFDASISSSPISAAHAAFASVNSTFKDVSSAAVDCASSINIG